MTTIRVQRKQTGTALLVAGCSLIGLFHGETQAQEHRFQETNVCEQTATELAKACKFEVQDSAKVATANCLNLLDPQAAADCKLAVNAARTEGNTQYGTGPVLKTKATTPMSPVVEFKYYVPGIGFALEVKPATGERLELVDYGPR